MRKLILTGVTFATAVGAAALAGAQIPGHWRGEFPAPQTKLTRWTHMTDMDANIPIVILINRTGGTLTDYTQLNIQVNDRLGIMSHGQGDLPNGQQRIIAPYIRRGGTVRMVYAIDGRVYPAWNSKGALRAGEPMVLTFLPKGKVTINKPYERI